MAINISNIKKVFKSLDITNIGNSNKVLCGDGTWMPSYNEPTYTVTGITGTAATINIDFSAVNMNTIMVTLPSGTTSATINFNNLSSKATSNTIFSFNVVVSHVTTLTATNSISWKFNTTSNPKWVGAVVPPSTVTANAVDVWSFFTYDSGSSLIGSLAMQDVR